MAKSLALTEAQIKDLKDLLEKRHEALRKEEKLELGSQLKTAEEGVDSEREEFSESHANAWAEQDLLERHNDEVQDIEQSFVRIDQGSYGICVDCHTSIDFARVLAYPTALRCLKCQVIHEIQGKFAR